MANDTSEDQPEQVSGAHTFLIADLRGYTRFSDEQGDEAASQLARSFAAIVRDAVPPQGGEVLELRGDEALCVFGSARAALWTAVELQRRFRERVDGEPALPLGVGIGLDAGEAVPTEGGYRGRALNVASRLCSLARPGEILASETVTNLAGRQEKARYAPRRPTRVKGLDEPVRLVELVPEVELPPLPPPVPSPQRRARARLPSRRTALLASTIAAVLASAVIIPLLSLRSGAEAAKPPPRVSVSPNSVVVIDPATNEIVDSIVVGRVVGPVVVGDGAIWTGNVADNTLSRIDPATRKVVQTIGLGITPDWLAAAAGALWILDTGCDYPCGGPQISESKTVTLTKLNPDTQAVGDPIKLGPGGLHRINVAADEEAVWVTNRLNSTVYRVDAETERVTAKVSLSDPAAIAVGDDAVWVVSGDALERIDPSSTSVTATIDVGTDPEGVALAGNDVWVSNFGPDAAIWRIDASLNDVESAMPVPPSPTALAADDDGVWTVHYQTGFVSRVDPQTSEVVTTVQIGRPAYVVAVGERFVWVTVR